MTNHTLFWVGLWTFVGGSVLFGVLTVISFWRDP